MLLKPKASERIVLSLYVTIALVFVLLSFITMDYPLYFNLYCIISAALAMFATLSNQISHKVQMYMMASCFLLMNTLYGTIYGSCGIIQDAFLALAAICSLYFCVKLNIFILCYTALFYLFCSVFYFDMLVSTLVSPKELSIRLIVLFLTQIILAALVSFIHRAQQGLIDKSNTFSELLRIVEIKKQDAVTASRTKADFLANMSHEIRTPMNAIVGMTEMVLRDDISPTVRENARNIKSAGNSLLAIINDILDFSKIESGKMEIINVNYQPTSVINDLINIITVRLTEKNLELIVSLDPTLPHELFGDEIRLRQILINLLNNAAKFTSAGYISLSISHRIVEERAVLTCMVSDTGSGIRDEDLSRLFESFSRLDTRQNRTIEGTGLGLSICKNLLDLMGGTISVQSEYGKGSTFSITLPQDITDSTPIAVVPKKDSLNVLFADASELQRSAAESDLNRLGVKVALAAGFEDILTHEGEVFSHIFVTKRLYDEHTEEIRRIAGDAKIAIIIDKKQLPSDYPGVLILRQPLYSAVYASVLNNAPRPVYEADEFHESFVAPDARILVVDDNAVNLKVVKGLLEPYKMQVTTAISGRDCLKLLETERYDLIFMDHMMPELDGIDTLKLIRKMPDPELQNVPVVALTANAVSGVREMFFREGFQDYVSKPIELAILEKTLKHQLPRHMIQKSAEIRTHSPEENCDIKLPGVDASRGMKSCGGSQDKYLDLLKVVYEDGVKKSAKLAEYADKKDYANYTIEAHALKSVAASIGAADLSAFAKEHEFAGKDGKTDFIDEKHEALIAQYNELLEALAVLLEEKEMLAPPPAEIPASELSEISAEALAERMEKLRTLIDNFDTDEAELIIAELNSCNVSNDIRSLLGQLSTLLGDYQYDDALALLDNT